MSEPGSSRQCAGQLKGAPQIQALSLERRALVFAYHTSIHSPLHGTFPFLAHSTWWLGLLTARTLVNLPDTTAVHPCDNNVPRGHCTRRPAAPAGRMRAFPCTRPGVGVRAAPWPPLLLLPRACDGLTGWNNNEMKINN